MATNRTVNTSKRLHRSTKSKIIAGVAGGLAEYFEIDPTIIRLIFVVLTFFHGSGILIYLLLWIILPADNQQSDSTNSFQNNIQNFKQKVEKFANDISGSKTKSDNKTTLGIIVIVIGLIFLLDNLGLNFSVGKFWPLILIVLGVILFNKR